MSTVSRCAICVIAVTLLQSVATPASETQVRRDEEQAEELEEVIVSAAKLVRSRRAMLEWLRRLVGSHSYEGYVELAAASGRQAVTGAGTCMPVVETAVQCEFRVRWPDIKAEDGTDVHGGMSTLLPAIVLYGLDWRYQGIRSLLVDNLGMAHGGLGELRGNTLTTTTPCVDLPGDCRRVSRVSAQSDGRMIRMEIDIEHDGSRIAHHVFQLRRVAEVQVRGKRIGQTGGAQP